MKWPWMMRFHFDRMGLFKYYKGGESPCTLGAGARYMGRGNWLPKNAGYEIADFAGFYVEDNPDDPYFSDDLTSLICQEMPVLFPSFEKVKNWEHDGLVVLENEQAQIVIGDNEWSLAAYVVIPNTDRFPHANLGKRNLRRYLAGLKSLLMKYYPNQVHFRTGPWTSGILRAAM